MKDRFFGKTATPPPLELKKPEGLECLDCTAPATVIYKGTTYCKFHAKELQRVGH